MLVSLTAAFIAGLALGAYVPYVPLTVSLLLTISAIVLARSRRFSGSTDKVLVFGALLIGVLYWSVFASLSAPSSAFSSNSKVERFSGTVVEAPRYAPGRVTVMLALKEMTEGGATRAAEGRVRLTWREPDAPVAHGDRLTVSGRLRAPDGMLNPGGFDYAAYLGLHGVDFVASVQGSGRVSVQQPDSTIPWPTDGLRWLDGWRTHIREAALASLDPRVAGLYLGMVTGEADWVPADVRDVFMATGTVHILSISGSHLGLIAWLLFVATTQACRLLPERWLLTLTRHVTPSRLAVLATGVATALYTLLAGAQIATMRSFVMIVLFLLAIWLGHPHRVLLTWSVAALLILWHDPRALFDISFQFSYLAVLTIALVLQRREEQGGPGLPPVGWSDRARSQLWEAAVMTAAVTLMTLPLSAYYFNQWPWLGLVSNLVIVPFAGFVFVPVGLLSAGAVIVTGAPALPGAEVVNGIGRMLLALVDALAAVPAADWHVASPAVLALAVFYGAIAATWWSLRSSALRVAGAVIASLLLVWWTWSPRFNDPDVTTVTFLDVGQGDAAVIERGDRVILVDGGSRFETLDMGRAVVGPYLWDRGIRRVDAVIATHPQLDHVGGLAWLVEHFEVGRIWTNGVDREEAFYRRLVDEAAARHVPLVAARAGDLVFGDAVCTMRVLNPPISGVFATPVSTPSGSMLNNLSVVTRLACGTHSVLFTTDIERLAIQRLAMDLGFDAEVVKIPHHGAASSFDAEWIATLHARTAVASVGRHNAYGHPIPAVLSTYEKQGIAVLRTDRDGAVQVRLRSSPGPVEVAETRRLAIQAVPQSVGWLRAEWRNLERLGHRWLGLTALS